MRNFKSHFKFNKQERSGIFFLLLIIVLLQVGYFFIRSFPSDDSTNSFSQDIETQVKIDALKEDAVRKDAVKIYPFNPNFITDYKGYTLGMSVDEIDRLHVFRAENRYVKSPEEFQSITLMSDSLLKVIAPYFKFPAWINKDKQSSLRKKQSENLKSNFNIKKEELKDLNSVTVAELKKIYGIGEKLSARIVKFRDRLGGFLVDDQLYDVYGLEPEVIGRTLKRYKVLNPPQIEKININTASVETLTKLIYLQKNVAINIVNYRNSKGSINSFAELVEIENFPKNKIDRIALYLSL